MIKYLIIIYWSRDDDAFLAEIPELEGCIAHGDTADEALKEVNIMGEEWLDIAREKGWVIPEPQGRLIYA